MPVHYTGFVVRDGAGRRRRAASTWWSRRAAGCVGEPLLRAAAEAQPATGVPMRLIAGPAPARRRVAARCARWRGRRLELRRTVPDLGAELRAARASVSQGGYNTALEVVRSGVPGAAVPYATPEEDEQTRRARRLERLGAVRVLAPERLVAATLAAELRRLLAFEPRPASVDLEGARVPPACSTSCWPSPVAVPAGRA